MNRKSLTAVALLASVTLASGPAAAQHTVGIGIPNAKSAEMNGAARCHDGDRHHGRDGTSFHCGLGDGWAYADGQWALYNNRSWDPDSYNDWWHDRPDRAYPRWVQQQRMQGSCQPDRMWWSGTGWHC